MTTRRIADLRAGNYAGTIERAVPNGRLVELRRNELPDGGFVTLYSDITEHREFDDRPARGQRPGRGRHQVDVALRRNRVA